MRMQSIPGRCSPSCGLESRLNFHYNSLVNPVKVNMPICLMMWSQFPGVPFALRAEWSSVLIEWMRLVMVVRFSILTEGK